MLVYYKNSLFRLKFLHLKFPSSSLSITSLHNFFSKVACFTIYPLTLIYLFVFLHAFSSLSFAHTVYLFFERVHTMEVFIPELFLKLQSFLPCHIILLWILSFRAFPIVHLNILIFNTSPKLFLISQHTYVNYSLPFIFFQIVGHIQLL